MNTFRFFAIAGGLALAASAIPAAAAPVSSQVTVRINPVELTTVEGRAAALDRITRAAMTACDVGTTTLGHLEQWYCQRDVAKQLVREVDSPELLAQWKGRTAIMTASRD